MEHHLGISNGSLAATADNTALCTETQSTKLGLVTTLLQSMTEREGVPLEDEITLPLLFAVERLLFSNREPREPRPSENREGRSLTDVRCCCHKDSAKNSTALTRSR